MAKDKRFTKQFAVVGTPTSDQITVAVADALKDYKAFIIRTAVDEFYELDDGELKPGDTVENAVRRVVHKIRKIHDLNEGIAV